MPALRGKDIPPGPWARDRRLPISTKLCESCGTLMAQSLVDAGERWHVTCGPARRPMETVEITTMGCRCIFNGSLADQVFTCGSCGASPEECSDGECGCKVAP
jgi:hypothetical protein